MKRKFNILLIFTFTFVFLLFLTGCKMKEPAKITIRYKAEPELFGTVKGSPVQECSAGDTAEWVMAVPRDGFTFISWSDGSTEPKRESDVFEKDTSLTAYFELIPYELPVLEITMPNGDEVASKEIYDDITLSVSNTDEEYCIKNVEAQLRGRGNATWKMEKKSYKLKLNEKENLLGQGKGPAKNWILLANYCDQTMLRNYLAFYLGNKLDGLEYTSSARFVELVINGKYIGVYLLCEQVQIQENRVNIEYNSDEVDTGYLIELDQYANDDEGNEEGVTYFTANSGAFYTLKSDTTPDQVIFIKNYVNKVDNAIKNGKKSEIEKLIDLDSCVDMYLVHEFMLNIDVGWSSFYLYKKPGEKLYFGPIWDFDLAAGNDKRLFAGGNEGIYAGDPNNQFKQRNEWFMSLMQNSWFRSLVKERWNEVKDIFDGASAETRQTANSMKKAIDRNYERWQTFRIAKNQEPDCIVILSTYRMHINHLCTWLEKRYTWFDSYISSDFTRPGESVSVYSVTEKQS